ncbi:MULTISPECIES: FAD-binding oxidoreductase [Streptomyces]|uniref:FAD-binding oxidoreductase n=1 Tax=Streptomyces TaxID=1883 RepID=UPI001CEC3605|nr:MULTISPECIES: FAD-binding oxidoreductase [Streptomyces]MDI6408378.1 FAD-binding oxidoreductase [Streptomyces albus]
MSASSASSVSSAPYVRRKGTVGPARAAPCGPGATGALPHPAGPRLLTGWGRTAPTGARVLRPRTRDEAVAALRSCGARGGIARGLGRSYGDAAQNAGGTVLDTTALDRVLALDAVTGTVTCEAGVSLHRLMTVLLPLGWFVPVTPGTRYVTVGGAIGADIHGKNHHISGSFTRHVRSMDLLTADGQVRTLTPGSELFDATCGGMGLTGLILSATFDLLPVETSVMSVDTERLPDLDTLLATLTATDHRYRYSVAWIDLLARGTAAGRAVLTRGDHAPLSALEGASGRLARAARREPLAFRPGRLPPPPRTLPDGLLRAGTVGAFNKFWYHKAPLRRRGELQRLASFFHPLDGLPHWNRIYGGTGFVQWQCVVPHEADDALRRVVRLLSRRSCPSFLAVLKRFGAAGPGWLSFPTEGWTLALDIPAGLPGLDGFLDRLDEEIAAAGGRLYLAKDARMRPELLTAMYPRLDDFRALRAEVDPRGLFTSDLARRLAL